MCKFMLKSSHKNYCIWALIFCVLQLSSVAFAQEINLEKLETLIIKFAQEIVASKPRAVSAKDDFDLSKTQIVTAVKFEYLQGIDQLGLLNIFQTYSSSGTTSGYRDRFSGEQRLLKRELDWHPTELRPKSAYLLKEGIEGPGFYSMYGNLFLVFRKSVWPRTTFTLRDSLEIIRDHKTKKKIPLVDSMFSLLHENSMLAKHESLASQSANYGLHYVEAQVWGPLNLYDVEEIYVLNSDYQENEKMLRALSKKYGFVVKTYEESTGLAHSHLVLKGRRVVTRKMVKPKLDFLVQQLKEHPFVLESAKYIDAISRLGLKSGMHLLEKMTQEERVKIEQSILHLRNLANGIKSEFEHKPETIDESLFIILSVALSREEALQDILKQTFVSKQCGSHL